MNLPINNNSEKNIFWKDVVFYSTTVLLIVVAFAWGLLTLKIYWQEKALTSLNQKINNYSTSDYQKAEKIVLAYKKKIDDLTQIIGNRKISSNVFSIIENDTLPKVWFSSFMMSANTNKISLSGEAENMQIFSQQVEVFENNNDYIKNVVIASSQIQPDGKVTFSLQITLDPKSFEYTDIFLPTAINKN